MGKYQYAFNGKEEGVAKALIKDSPISTKVAIEIANYLRGRSTKKAKTILELVLKKQHAIPFKRFDDGVGHRTGSLAAGRYPQKASEHFLELITLAENNASQKGLSEDLIIMHLAAHQASRPYHYGRQRRRKMKRTHVELVVQEDVKAAKKKTTKKAHATPKTADHEQKTEAKTETKVTPTTEAKPAVKAPAHHVEHKTVHKASAKEHAKHASEDKAKDKKETAQSTEKIEPANKKVETQ